MWLAGPPRELIQCGVVLVGVGAMLVAVSLARPSEAASPDPPMTVSGVRRLLARALPGRPMLADRLARHFPALAGVIGALVGLVFLAAGWHG